VNQLNIIQPWRFLSLCPLSQNTIWWRTHHSTGVLSECHTRQLLPLYEDCATGTCKVANCHNVFMV